MLPSSSIFSFSRPLVYLIIMWHSIDPCREILFPLSERSTYKVRHWAPSLQLMEILCLVEDSQITTRPPLSCFYSFDSSHYIPPTGSITPSVPSLLLLLTLGVNVLRQFQGVRVCQVSVGWSDSQDQAALSGDELHDHVPDLLLNVCRLVSNWHLSDPR